MQKFLDLDDEQKKAYETEYIKELARIEASFADPRVTKKEKLDQQLKFVISFWIVFLTGCIGYIFNKVLK